MAGRQKFCATVAAVGAAGFLAGIPGTLRAQEPVTIDGDDIGGLVTGPNGPETGVWVIAETTDLPTKFAKIVVTDDRGRYLVPDLPKAQFKVWVRGYGLVNSAKVKANQEGSSTCARCRPLPRGRRRNIIPPSTGTRC